MPNPPAFDPLSLPEANSSIMPEPLRAKNQTRWYRRLGAASGLTNFGVNLCRIVPGGQSSYRHAHSLQDEFVWVLEGRPTLVSDAGEQVLASGITTVRFDQPAPGLIRIQLTVQPSAAAWSTLALPLVSTIYARN